MRGSSSLNRYTTPTKESQGVLSASAKRINLSIRRELSKSFGDLSNLRPKSPPIQNLPARLDGLNLSPGNYVDDTQNLFSPSYNRQARQAIPNDWINSESGTRPSTTTEWSASAGQQMYHSPLYDMHTSQHTKIEPATISIRGLTSGYNQPLDFCVPITRSHPGDEGQRLEALHADTRRNLAVEHINISTAWNGLSDVDANELFRVHQVFVSTLENMLANEIWQIYQQLQQQDSIGNISPIHTLFTAGIVRGISFCRDQLVREMAEALYSSKETAAKSESGFLRLYLVATDALVQHHEDESRDTSITIRMRCDALSPRPCPAVDAAWVPDFLVFEGLDESPLEGQSFSVIPRYCSKSAFRPTQFPKNVRYSIESESQHYSLSWLVWDDEIAGFEGIVPFYSEVNGYGRHVANANRDSRETTYHSLKIVVQAVLVDDNGSSIRYERILRARLTIKVIPWYVSGNSCETKERLSIPKAYQDSRLAAAAQCFAIQDSMRSPLYSGRSPGGLSHWSKGAHQYMPIKYVHTIQAGFEDNQSVMSLSDTRAGLKETGMPSLTRTQAYLVAKCADLNRELDNVKEKIMMSSRIDEHHKRTLYATDPQDSANYTYSVPSTQYTERIEPTRRSPVRRISHDASENPTNPSSPSLHERDAAFQLGPIARYSALPLTAINPRTRPKSDLQMKDGSTLDATCTGWESTPRPGTTCQTMAPEGLTTQNTQSAQEPDYLWRMPNQASISSDDISRFPRSPRRHAEDLSTLPLVKCELATLSTSGKRDRNRRLDSSFTEISPLKRSEETGNEPKQETGARSAKPGRNTLSILASEDQASCSPPQRSGGIFYNSFNPLLSPRSSTTLASEDALCLYASESGGSTNSSKNAKHQNLDSGCYINTKDTDSGNLVNKTFPVSSGFEDGAAAMEGVPSNLSFPERSGQVRQCQSTSASFSPRHVSTSSTSGSCSTSSEMDFIVEQDPHAREVSRREQAKSWKLLCRSDSIKENHPGPKTKDVRLSEDEKKAMDEAMRRSLDDLAEGFDDIFLEDSSESGSSDIDL